MKYTLIYIVLVLMFSVGCEKTWDDHYGYDDDPRIAAASLTAWEVLNENEEKYSKFITLVKRSGYDYALNSNRMLTVWAPDNKFITDDIMALDSLNTARFVKNHLNALPLFKTKVTARGQINTLEGKYLNIRIDYENNGDQNVYIADKLITKFDMACTNGVVHEVDGILVPLKSLSDYLMECGDEYQLFRDSMIGRNDTIFLPEASFPIGVNHLGQTIYDSVYEIENSLLYGLDLSSEDRVRTLCLPSNAVIEEAFTTIASYMESIDRPFLSADSAACFEWIMRASILNGRVNDYAYAERYSSAFGAEIRPAKQLVRSEFVECSNGYVYIFETLYLPRSVFMYDEEVSLVSFPNVEHINDTLPEDAKMWRTSPEGARLEKMYHLSLPFLSVGGDKGNYIEFQPIRLDIYSNPSFIKLMPGKYAVYAQFLGYPGTAHTNISINGEAQYFYRYGDGTKLEYVTGSGSWFPYNKIVQIVDTVEIKVADKYSSPVIKLTATNAYPIKVQRMRFTQVGEDNY